MYVNDALSLQIVTMKGHCYLHKPYGFVAVSACYIPFIPFKNFFFLEEHFQVENSLQLTFPATVELILNLCYLFLA